MSEPVKRRLTRHRHELRAAGLRLLQIWVPDTRSPGFAKEARRQSMLLWDDVSEKDTLDWLAEVADTTGWQ
jgi:hypothetical protein